MTLRILHIATGLGMGGAETSLANLLAFINRSEFEPRVLSLSTDLSLADRIRALGLQVDSLGMLPGRIVPADFPRLIRYIRMHKPDLIQTWMYHADLLGALAATFAGHPPTVWGLHLTVNDMKDVKRSTRLVIYINMLLSHILPARIVCCAENTRRDHIDLGYAHKKMIVIPNGFDLSKFQPDASARSEVRTELGVSPETLLIGMAARFHPQKDHANFIAAAACLEREMPKAHFVLWGKDINWNNSILRGLIESTGLKEKFHLLGLRTDVSRLTAAMDIATLSSARGEAFPMVIGEAMACAIPCVVTEVGDAAEMVAETGCIVKPRDAEALANGWLKILSLSRKERIDMGLQARKRVTERYDIHMVSAQYSKLYKDIMNIQQK